MSPRQVRFARRVEARFSPFRLPGEVATMSALRVAGARRTAAPAGKTRGNASEGRPGRS